MDLNRVEKKERPAPGYITVDSSIDGMYADF